MRDFDSDPIDALSAALASLLERDGDTWPELLAAAPFTPTRRAALLTGEPGSLDDLAAELNETRSLPA